MNPDHELTLHYFKIHFNIIFPSTLRSNDPPFPLAVINKNLAYILAVSVIAAFHFLTNRELFCAALTYFARPELFDRLQTK